MVSSSWLTKQRKSALIDLAGQAGLELYETTSACYATYRADQILVLKT